MVAQFAKLDPPIVVNTNLNPVDKESEGDETTTLNYGGDSHNGTSGPNPPENYGKARDLFKSDGKPIAPPMSAEDTATLKKKIPNWPNVDLQANHEAVPDQGAAIKEYYNQFQYDEVLIDVVPPEVPSIGQSVTTSSSDKLYYACVNIYQPSKPSGGGGPPSGGRPPRRKVHSWKWNHRHAGRCPTSF